MSLTSNLPVDGPSHATVPFLPVESQPMATPALPVDEPTGPASSDELRAEIERIQIDEQVLIDRDKQAKLARLRDLARFD